LDKSRCKRSLLELPLSTKGKSQQMIYTSTRAAELINFQLIDMEMNIKALSKFPTKHLCSELIMVQKKSKTLKAHKISLKIKSKKSGLK
jgi:hypothetical protein